MKDALLDLPARRGIFHHIKANPGIHFREIQRNMGLPIGQLEYHLDRLIKGELITKEELSGNARFFVRDTFSREERRIMSILRKEIPRDIVLFLLDNPHSTPTDILGSFDFTGPNLSYHLRRMVSAGIIDLKTEGRERRYFVEDEEAVGNLLIMYHHTLMDRVVDAIS